MAQTVSGALLYVDELLQNAEALVLESRLLFTHRRWARAFALAVLAEEETGKAFLAISGQMPVDELANLKTTRHADKLIAAAITEVAFLSEMTDFAAQAGAIDGMALHREKLGALYVDAHSDGIRSPSALTEERAQPELDRAERLVRWTKAQLGTIDAAAIEAAALVGSTLTQAMEQYVLDHGIDAGIHLMRQLAEWGRTQALLQADEPQHGSSGE